MMLLLASAGLIVASPNPRTRLITSPHPSVPTSPIPAAASSLHDQLILAVVDKLLIALVLLVAGFLLNQAFERYKNREATRTEFAKQRLQKIAETWTVMYEWEGTLKQFVREAGELAEQFGSDTIALSRALAPPGLQFDAVSRQKKAAMRDAVESGRFWLGEDMYMGFRRYETELIKFFELMEAGSVEKARKQGAALDSLKRDILQWLE